MNRDFEYQWGRIVARAWGDPAFKAKLLADPAAALEEYGLATPAGLQIKVVENTDKAIHLVLPVKPAPQELSEEELHRVAGARQGNVCDSDFCYCGSGCRGMEGS